MTDLLSHLVDAPLANILILAGLAFLAIGIVGKISGKIEPSTTGRVMSGLLGVALLIYGLYPHAAADAARPDPEQTPQKRQQTARRLKSQRSQSSTAGAPTPEKRQLPDPRHYQARSASKTSDRCVRP